MKARIWLSILFALLVALCAFGQTFQRSLPFLARSIGTPDYLNGPGYGVEYHWVASDYALTNSSATSNWVDRVQSKPWAFPVGNTITNVAGVGFSWTTDSVDNYFTNPAGGSITAWNDGNNFTNCAITFVVNYKWKLSNSGANPNGYGYVWVGNSENYHEVVYRDNDIYYIESYGAGGMIHAAVGTGEWYVVTFYVTNNPADSFHLIISSAINGSIQSTVTNRLGAMYSFGIWPCITMPCTYFKGELSEIIIQTNMLSVAPAVLVSNVNKYCVTTLAQFQYTNRTNIWGVPLVAQYVGSDYTTNAGVPTWPDRSTNGFNLTNLTAATTYPTSVPNGLGTSTTVSFSAATTNYLNSVRFTNTAASEYFVVFKMTSHGTAQHDIIFENYNNAVNPAVAYRDKTADSFSLYFGSSHVSSKSVTNTFLIYDVVLTGTASGSGVYTNGVAGATGNAGTATMNGFILGCEQASGVRYNPTTIEIAEIIAYRGNLGTLTRSRVYNELKATYGL